MTAVVRIFFNPLDARSMEEYTIEPGRQIIDWLQEFYPCGFDGVLRCFVGIEEIAIEDLDYVVQEADQVTMLVMPSGITWAAVAQFAIQAVIAFAVGYVINLIFQPDVPGRPDDGEESAVYSLSPTRNRARLGEPIEVVYGTVSYPPSFAAAPYSFNVEESNDQFVDELLCLGQGHFSGIEITIGEAPEQSFEAGAVRWWLYSPDDHNSTAGVIEADIWNRVQNTEAPFRFYENLYTSPEVDNFEFRDRQTESSTGFSAFMGDAYAQHVDPVTGETILGRIENIDTSILTTFTVSVGDDITLQNTASNNSTFRVGSVVRDPLNPDLLTIFQAYNDTNQIADESPLPGPTEYEINTSVDSRKAGPYRCQKKGQRITEVICDFLWPNGLFHRDGTDGDMKDASYTLDMTVQEIDEDTGAPIGAPLVITNTFTARTQSPYRAQMTSGTLTAGTYEVSVARNGFFNDWRTTENLSLTAVKGVVELDTTPGATYGPVTLLAIRMKATNGLAQAARSRIRVKATRVLDPTDPTVDSSNPMTAIKDVWSNTVYGGKRPLAELDLAHIDPIEEEWAIPDYGPKLNGAFDQRSTVHEGMQAIASMTGSKVIQDGGLTTVIQEKKQLVRKALFSSANIVRDSLEINYNFDTQGDFDGIEVEYRNPDTFVAEYAYYPESPKPTTPDTYTLFGVTDGVYAQQMARYLWNVKENRRKLAKHDVELDGWLTRFGDRIGISMPMPNWGQSGVVVEVLSAVSVRVDQALDWQGDDAVMLRTDRGEPDGPYDVTQGASADIIVFGEVPAIPLVDMEGREPSSYIFGQVETMIRDFVVSKVEPRGETLFTIESQTYSDLIYEGAPPHMRGPGQGYSELLFGSDELATGFVSNQSLIVTNQQDPENPDPENDGRRIMIAPTGSSWIQYSDDFGATWGSKVVVVAVANGMNVTYMQRVEDDDSWWCVIHDDDAAAPAGIRNRYGMRSIDDGATWTQIVEDSSVDYSYGLLIEEDQTVHAGGRDTSPPNELELYTKNPGNAYWNPATDADTTYQPLTSPLKSSWACVYLGQIDDENQYYWGLDGEGASHRYGVLIWPGPSPGGPVLFNYGGNDSHIVCSAGNGKALIYKGGTGTSVITLTRLDLDELPSNPLTDVEVEFSSEVVRPRICYDRKNDRYYVFAWGTSPNQHILHVAYTEASTDLDEWTLHPTIDIVYGKAIGSHESSVTWAYDNTFYLAYEKGSYTSTSGEHKVFLKVVLFEDAPVPPMPEVVHMADFEGTIPEATAYGRNFRALTMQGTDNNVFIESSSPLFGSQSVKADWLDTGRGYLWSHLNYTGIEIDDFTLDMTIRVLSLDTAVGTGLFSFGGQEDEEGIRGILEGTSGTNGKMIIRRKYKPASVLATLWQLDGPTLSVSDRVDIRIEVDPYRARLYIDGDLYDEARYYNHPHTGDEIIQLMRSYPGSGAETQAIYGQHIVDNYRLSKGKYEGANYTPAEYFPAPKPVGTLIQCNFDDDLVTCQVGGPLEPNGSLTHEVGSPLYGIGSARLDGTNAYLRLLDPVGIDASTFTMQISATMDNLTSNQPVFAIGRQDDNNNRLVVGHRSSDDVMRAVYVIGGVFVYSLDGPVVSAGVKYDIALEHEDNGANTTATLFINGAVVAQTTFASFDSVLDQQLYVGRGNSGAVGNNHYFDGVLDEFKFDTRVALFGGSAYTPSLPHAAP